MPTDKYGHCFLGVDYATPPHELSKAAFADASNVVPDERGLPTGRGGSVKYNSVSLVSRITSFHEFRSGSTFNQLTSYSTKIAYYNSGTGEFVDSITGLTSNKMLQWVNFAGKAISVNEGSNVPQYWTDASTKGNLPGSPVTGNTIAQWSSRLWFGGDATNIALLTGSDLNDPENYTAGGAAGAAVSQTVGDSKDSITGLFGFFDELLVGKKNNIYKVSSITNTPTDGSSLKIKPLYTRQADNIGFTSPWAITQVGNDVIFLDGFDIKRLSGIQEFGDVEQVSIIAHLGDFLENTADKDRLKYTQFFHYKKKEQIWITIPTGSATHYVFILDYKFKAETGRYAFYPMGGLIANVINGVADGDTVDIYYGDETGFVRQIDTGNNDDGGAITRYFVNVISGNDIKEGILDRHEYRKGFLNTEAFALPEQSTLVMVPSYALDLMNDVQIRTGGNYTNLSSETVTGWDGTGVKHKRVPLRGLAGNTLALKWTHATVNENFTFYPSTLQYKFKSKNLIT